MNGFIQTLCDVVKFLNTSQYQVVQVEAHDAIAMINWLYGDQLPVSQASVDQ
jgi:hypothetical protein